MKQSWKVSLLFLLLSLASSCRRLIFHLFQFTPDVRILNTLHHFLFRRLGLCLIHSFSFFFTPHVIHSLSYSNFLHLPTSVFCLSVFHGFRRRSKLSEAELEDQRALEQVRTYYCGTYLHYCRYYVLT